MIFRCSGTLIFASIVTIFISCSAPKKVQKPVITNVPAIDSIKTATAFDPSDTFFEVIFEDYPGVFDNVLKNRKDWNVQVIYTQIDRDDKGTPKLLHHYFNSSEPRYFYPASTVKFPVALLALEKVKALSNKYGTDLKKSAMITGDAYSGQSAVYNDPNTINGVPSIAQYIKKIFLVSDNDAYNRLYEFLGQEHINAALHKKGYTDAQILHRLDIFLSEDENRHTNPVSFYDTSGRLIMEQPMLFNKKQYAKRSDYLGNGYYSGGRLINKPMSFSAKNRLSLSDLHTILQSLIFPESVPSSRRFDITEEDRLFVLKYMSQFPRESVYPYYDSSYTDSYAKPIMFGDDKNSLPKNIRIFDKSGAAYGQLIDVAYIIDTVHNIEFMVSAAIYCNSDGILNDDNYDYRATGYPFLKNLGKALYNYEIRRKRKYQPDLSSFIFTYDK